jgi:hypothetical protein
MMRQYLYSFSVEGRILLEAPSAAKAKWLIYKLLEELEPSSHDLDDFSIDTIVVEMEEENELEQAKEGLA